MFGAAHRSLTLPPGTGCRRLRFVERFPHLTRAREERGILVLCAHLRVELCATLDLRIDFGFVVVVVTERAVDFGPRYPRIVLVDLLTVPATLHQILGDLNHLDARPSGIGHPIPKSDVMIARGFHLSAPV